MVERVSDEGLRHIAGSSAYARHERSMARELLKRREAERQATVVEHDPDGGCLGCQFWRDNAKRQGVCGVSGPIGRRLRTMETAVTCAPDWCPLRTGPVIVKTPEAE